MMDIVFTCDDNYAMPCGITMISVLKNNKRTPITFHILGMGLTVESKEKLLSITRRYSNASLMHYDLDQEMLKSHNFSLLSLHLTIVAYARFFLADLLSNDIDKLLYLDPDMIVKGDLLELWNTDIDNYSVAGVPDPYCMFNTGLYNVFGYSDTFRYINTGLLLINLKYWRTHNIKDAFIKYYNENCDNLIFEDQDVLNGVLAESKLLLPIKYNVIDYYYLCENKILNEYTQEIENAMNNPIVIHYTSSRKPWLGTCRHPLKREFLKYKRISPWKNTPLLWNQETPKQKRRYRKISLLMRWELRESDIYIPLKRNFLTGKYNFQLVNVINTTQNK